MRNDARRGASLLELILVMVVIFTISTVVAPRFSDFFPSLQVGKTTDRVFAWVRKARADAALTGAAHRFCIDPNTRRYWIEYEPRPLKEPGKFKELGGTWEPEETPDGVEFETLQGFDSKSGRQVLEFRADGTTDDATITLANDRGDRRTIKITGASGRIVIEPIKEGP
jgi:Tfp pilus assembly protein FimT